MARNWRATNRCCCTSTSLARARRRLPRRRWNDSRPSAPHKSTCPGPPSSVASLACPRQIARKRPVHSHLSHSCILPLPTAWAATRIQSNVPAPFTRINVMMHADLIDQDDLLSQLRSLGFDVASSASAEQACECAVRGLSEARAKALKKMVEQMYSGSATILPAVRQAIDKQLLPALMQFKQKSGA